MIISSVHVLLSKQQRSRFDPFFSSREFCLRLYCDVFHGELACTVYSMVFMGFGLGCKGLDRWKYEGTNVYVTIRFNSTDVLFI